MSTANEQLLNASHRRVAHEKRKSLTGAESHRENQSRGCEALVGWSVSRSSYHAPPKSEGGARLDETSVHPPPSVH